MCVLDARTGKYYEDIDEKENPRDGEITRGTCIHWVKKDRYP
jgi:hypothetical protein